MEDHEKYEICLGVAREIVYTSSRSIRERLNLTNEDLEKWTERVAKELVKDYDIFFKAGHEPPLVLLRRLAKEYSEGL